MTSHDPLTIAGLERSQVQILYRDADGAVRAGKPATDPRGLGVSGVLRQIFGLATTLDPETQAIVDHRNTLVTERLKAEAEGRKPPDELTRTLSELNDQLDGLGLAYQSNDPSYDAYLRAVHRVERDAATTYTPEEIEAQNRVLEELIEGLR